MVKVLIPQEDGGILNKKGVVDYTIGKGVAPGVFCHRRGRASAHHRAHGRSARSARAPTYSFFRPYHLTSLEVPLTARAHHALRQARHGAAAEPGRRSLRGRQARSAAGETFDAIGETCYRGWTMTAAEARAQRPCRAACLRAAR